MIAVFDSRAWLPRIKASVLRLAAVAMIGGGSAGGASIVAEIQGNVTYVKDVNTGVVVGDPIRARLRYNLESAPDFITPEQAIYHNLERLSLDILHDGAAVHSFSATGGTTMVVSSSRFYAFQATGREGLEDESLLGQPLAELALILQNDAPVSAATIDLPAPLLYSAFDPSLSFIDVNVGDNTVIEAHITSIHAVPEPASGSLGAVLAFITLIALRRGVPNPRFANP